MKNSAAKTTPKAPKTLSPEARAWWRRVRAEYGIEDDAGLLLLQTAMEAFDRMKMAERNIKRCGLIQKDRFGQPRANPAVTIERDSRAAMLAALRQMNLDIEPLRDSPGGPGGS